MKHTVSFADFRKSARFALAFALLFAVGSFGFYACKQKDIQENVKPSNALVNTRNDKKAGRTYAEQVLYVQTHLTVLGKATLLLSQDEEFRTKLYADIEEQFDGDFNSLYQKLATLRGSDNVLLGSKLNAKVQLIEPSSSLQAELNAFQSIEDTINAFPQIYIHNYQEHKEAGNLATPFTGKNPVVIIHTGDTQADPIGFTLNANNEIITTNEPITEAYAENCEVWVISINERVDNNATVLKDEYNTSG